ncbi:alpha/beta hydrolase [Pseudomonas canadensis]|uniref:alpha/beta hydrolase n=1 Tax=Pseudomonas canadensis TaxID=915099 RepID=UPI002B253F19|nr:alpha/beta hydrolase [Pseudomonas canadensis]MEB2647755.1 alpha/beta hydrolase [Pseudomonas canadensis]
MKRNQIIGLVAMVVSLASCAVPPTSESIPAPAPAPAPAEEPSPPIVEKVLNNKVEVNIGGDLVEVPASLSLGVVKVLYATNRNLSSAKSVDRGCESTFGYYREPDDGRLWYGYCDVKIPMNHVVGVLESPAWYKFEFSDDPKKHVTLVGGDVISKSEFDGLLTRGLAKTGTSFLYVHGYNVGFKEAAKRTGQMAYDLKFTGVPMFFSWPSKGEALPYTNDEPTSEFSGGKLYNFLVDYLSRPDVKGLYVIAHSMGSRTVTTALSELYRYNPKLRLKIKEVILAAPDIDAGTFRLLIAPKISNVGVPVTMYVSSRDRALALSKKVHAAPRLGQFNNGSNVYPGIDTIDASGLDAGFVGHSYYGDSCSVITDISDLFDSGRRAVEREGRFFEAKDGSGGRYWRLLPYTKPPIGVAYPSKCVIK